MRLDEVIEALRAIKALQPCPYCGVTRSNTETPVMHDVNCPIPKELIRYDFREVDE